jgi:hypothetical protein
MALTAERPGLLEQYAVAVGSGQLVMHENRGGPLDVIVAMGYAGLVQRGGMASNPERITPEQIAVDLAPTLWRARDAMDKTAYERAALLLAQWLQAKREYFAEVELADPGILLRFAGRVIQERVKQTCKACGGFGKQQLGKGGRPQRAVGIGPRHARLVRCEQCGGSGRRRTSIPERKRVLGGTAWRVSEAEYTMFWRRQFAWAHHELRDLATQPREYLQFAMRGPTVAP